MGTDSGYFVTAKLIAFAHQARASSYSRDLAPLVGIAEARVAAARVELENPALAFPPVFASLDGDFCDLCDCALEAAKAGKSIDRFVSFARSVAQTHIQNLGSHIAELVAYGRANLEACTEHTCHPDNAASRRVESDQGVAMVDKHSIESCGADGGGDQASDSQSDDADKARPDDQRSRGTEPDTSGGSSGYTKTDGGE